MSAWLPHTRKGLIWSIIVLVGLVGLAFLWWLNGNPEAVLTPDGEAYGSSLAREIDQAGAKCTDQPDRAWWVCEVETDAGSGYSGIYYLLYEHADGCWRGTRYRPEVVQKEPPIISPVPRGRSISGCLTLRDFVLPKTVDAPAPPALPLGPPEEQQVRAAVENEFDALASERWAVACRLRTQADRAALSAVGGSCEQALAQVFTGAGQSLARPQVVKIQITGGEAQFEVRPAGESLDSPAVVPNHGVAIKEDGQWRIQQPRA